MSLLKEIGQLFARQGESQGNYQEDLLRSRSIVQAAIKVAIAVGMILKNLINQGSRLFDGLPNAWLHADLNYRVPYYCVSSYSAARNEMFRTEEKA